MGVPVHSKAELPLTTSEPLVFGVEEAARLLGCNHKTVRRYIHDGTLRAFQLGRTWKVRRTELQNFILRQEKQAAQRLGA